MNNSVGHFPLLRFLALIHICVAAPVRGAETSPAAPPLAIAATNAPAVPSTNSSSANTAGAINADSLAARYEPTSAAQLRQRWLLSGLIVALLAMAGVYLRYKRSRTRDITPE